MDHGLAGLNNDGHKRKGTEMALLFVCLYAGRSGVRFPGVVCCRMNAALLRPRPPLSSGDLRSLEGTDMDCLDLADLARGNLPLAPLGRPALLGRCCKQYVLHQ
jgi:hypothetical protein